MLNVSNIYTVVASWVSSLIPTKTKEVDYDTWYKDNVDSMCSKKSTYVFYFHNGLAIGTKDWIDANSGINSFPWFDKDDESDKLWLQVTIDNTMYDKYIKLVKHCGGEVYSIKPIEVMVRHNVINEAKYKSKRWWVNDYRK